MAPRDGLYHRGPHNLPNKNQDNDWIQYIHEMYAEQFHALTADQETEQLCRLARVFLAEFIHATGGIHDFLFTGEKRMATGADFHVQIPAQGGARDEAVATAASHGDFLIFGVDTGFHASLDSRNSDILKGAHDNAHPSEQQVSQAANVRYLHSSKGLVWICHLA